MNLITCPVCQNECSPLASSCPKCGHPIIKENEISESIGVNKWKVFAVIMGILLGGLLTFGIYNLFFNKPQTSVNTTTDVKSSQEVANTGSSQKTDNPASALSPKPTPEPKAVVNLEAGVVYNYGGAQPVSRTEFCLLDADLNNILKQAGVTAKKDSSAINSPIIRLAFAYQYPDQDPQVLPRARPAIKSHSKYCVTTDFQGKAQFQNVTPNNYYVYGYTETRKGFAIWNMKIQVVAGENKIVLDQGNAATAF